VPARKTRRKKASPGSQGLAPRDVVSGEPPADFRRLAGAVGQDGAVLGSYRDPLGGRWLLLAALPVDSVEPTPYQRDLSDTHVRRLADAIEALGRFLDPIVAVRAGEGKYWTPNGHHRLAALRKLGARTVTALVVPDQEVARRILALNTEKAHNLREKSLEVSRLAEALERLDDRPESEFETEFEEPALLTLGRCYQANGRFAGGAYHPVLKRIESFLNLRLSKARAVRDRRAAKLASLDEAVGKAVADLKARGFQSPYLRPFVIARVNPLRFKKEKAADFDDTIDAMLAAARKFDAARVRADQLAAAAGPAEE
jgi:ParB family chromosome partitioning protein